MQIILVYYKFIISTIKIFSSKERHKHKYKMQGNKILWCYNEKIKIPLNLMKFSNWWRNIDVEVIKMVLKVYLEIPLNKNRQHTATSQLACKEI